MAKKLDASPDIGVFLVDRRLVESSEVLHGWNEIELVTAFILSEEAQQVWLWHILKS